MTSKANGGLVSISRQGTPHEERLLLAFGKMVKLTTSLNDGPSQEVADGTSGSNGVWHTATSVSVEKLTPGHKDDRLRRPGSTGCMDGADGSVDDDHHKEAGLFGGVTRRMRIAKTASMVCCGVAMGAPFTVLGPTMLEMTELMNANFEQMSWGSTAVGMGMAVGCTGGGVLCDRFRPQMDILIFSCCLTTGICVAILSWSPALAMFYTLMSLAGITTGVLRTTCFALTGLMWGDRSSTPMHLLFAGTTVGLLLPALLAPPFLSEEIQEYAYDGNVTTIVSEAPSDPQKIRSMFVIVGALIAVLGLPFLIFYLTGSRYSPMRLGKMSLKETISPRLYSPGKPVFGVVFVSTFFVIFFICFMHASVCNIFLFTISVDDYGMSKTLSSTLMVVFFLVEVVGRVFFGFLSKCIRIQGLLMAQLLILLLFSFALVSGALDTATDLWGVVLSQQFFSGAMYATYVPWANRYVEFTGVVTSVSQIAIAVGFAVGAAISGSLYERHGEASLWYFWLALVASLVVFTVPLQVAAARTGERFLKTQKTVDSTQSEQPA